MADNENYQYNTATGIVVPDTSKVKEQVEQEFKTALGEDLDTTESTPQGRLIEAETVARKRTIENMALLANMFNPQQAYGIFLDSIASLFGIERVGATRTRVLCQLTGTANTVIPANSQAKDNNGNIYYCETSITLDSEGNGEGYFVCMVKGAIDCPVNSLTQIVTAVIGWDSINNDSSGVIGKNGESDLDLRNRINISQYRGRALVQSVRSALYRIETLKSCYVKDNPNNTSQTIVNPRTSAQLVLPPHSLYVCVLGGSDDDVAKAIFDTKSIGCAYASSNNETIVIDIDNAVEEEYPIYFDRATAVSIEVKITVDVSQLGGTSTQNEEAIKEAIKAYANGEIESVDGLKIGTTVSPFEIASAVSIQIPQLFIKEVKICVEEGTLAVSNIPIGINEYAIIEDNNITVVQE